MILADKGHLAGHWLLLCSKLWGSAFHCVGIMVKAACHECGRPPVWRADTGQCALRMVPSHATAAWRGQPGRSGDAPERDETSAASF